MLLEDKNAGALQGGTDGGHLLEDLITTAVFQNHILDTVNLAFNSSQALEDFFPGFWIL
jgi:hypothetical protein